MKKLYYAALIILSVGNIRAQNIEFPDPKFKTRLLQSSPTKFIVFDINSNPIAIDANADGEVQVNEALNVYYLNLSHADSDLWPKISSLDGIENFTNLISISAGGNILTSFNYAFANLTNLGLEKNQLTEVNVSQLPQLLYLEVRENLLTTLDCSGLSQLLNLSVSENQLTSINLAGLSNVKNFTAYQNQLTSVDLTPLTSIELLTVSDNLLTSLNVNSLVTLKDLSCYTNQLTALDVSNLTNLTGVTCSENMITSLDFSSCNLTGLSCGENQLTTLNLTGQIELQWLECSFNQLTTLNLAGFGNMLDINCTNNQLTSIDLSGNYRVEYIGLSNNALTSINLNDCHSLTQFGVQNNNLQTLLMKNGNDQEYTSFNFQNNPNLEYICADENEFALISQEIIDAGLTNCQVGDYCTFTPGGVFYTISGIQKFDADTNGCDLADDYVPYAKFSVTNGADTQIVFPNTTGSYNLFVATGEITVTPILTHPQYFNVSPSSISVTFPDDASPFVQNFCIIPNGAGSDLQVILIPVDVARPGFNATYKIIASNIGNQMQNAVVNFNFNDALVDFVSANPVVTAQMENTVSWSIVNLEPFQTMEFSVTLNINSPMETPPVNGGDILNSAALITIPPGDQTTGNNSFGLKQDVVNSFDPNDKTCLEGNTISPEMVGEYVHYLIRFENTGTFAAENIVVKDMIDPSKFDVNSLIPIDGSHTFETRISEGNKVEFIFENIMLPFDDANNDGYVAFKIRTLPTLVIGDTFENNASIYFDYNFPIVTNTTSTMVQVLNTPDFEFDKYFTIYPNPANDILNIHVSDSIMPKSVAVYNTLGQLVFATTGWQPSVDLSRTGSGTYFIRIETDKGSSVKSFIKN